VASPPPTAAPPRPAPLPSTNIIIVIIIIIIIIIIARSCGVTPAERSPSTSRTAATTQPYHCNHDATKCLCVIPTTITTITTTIIIIPSTIIIITPWLTSVADGHPLAVEPLAAQVLRKGLLHRLPLL
jgi:hypothetical protein